MHDFTFGKTGAKNWVCARMREGERVDVCPLAWCVDAMCVSRGVSVPYTVTTGCVCEARAVRYLTCHNVVRLSHLEKAESYTKISDFDTQTRAKMRFGNACVTP